MCRFIDVQHRRGLAGCGRKVYILVTLVCVGHSVLYDVITTARPHDHEKRGHDMHREGLLHGSSPTRTRILYPEAPEVAAAAAWYMGASPHRPESALRHWAFASPGVVILYFTAVQFSSPGQLREHSSTKTVPLLQREFTNNASREVGERKFILVKVLRNCCPSRSRPGRHGPATALHVLSTPRHCLHTCHPWGRCQ